MDSIQRIQKGEWHWEMDPKMGEFHFNCTSCGSCCRGDMTISLNLADLHRMGKYLNLSVTGDLFREGWIERLSLENGGFRPVIKFREQPIRFCPFLENRLEDTGKLLGLCKLHPELKPLVCKLAPVGRELAFDEKLEPRIEWFFTEPVHGCPGCKIRNKQRLEDPIQAHETELSLEIRYFRIMERLQRSRVVEEVFLSFHENLRIDDNLERYLQEWECRRDLIDF